MEKHKILIATHPFGKTGLEPLEKLKESGHELLFNPFKRRLKKGEVGEMLKNVDAVIAGTEPYNAETLSGCEQLKVISRVGIGLDSVDLRFCESHEIKVAYTPDAPSDAVAELTVANILNLLRHIHESDRSVREGAWNRLMGKLIREITLGVVGVGRIGSRVIKLLQPFSPRILAVDTDEKVRTQTFPNTEWAEFDEVLRKSDLITLHIPLNKRNYHSIDRDSIAIMKTGAMIVNNSRGPVIDENALYDALLQKHLAAAALDVFEEEPYYGPMSKLENVVLTAHIAASATQSRFLMESGAVENCLSVLEGNEPVHDAVKDNSE